MSHANRRTLIIVLTTLCISFFAIQSVQAQIQDFNFSGNNPDSYQCFDTNGGTADYDILKDDVTGIFYCDVNGNGSYDPIVVATGAGDTRAVLRPPQLQQLEVWFVRIVYTIWAFVASFSFLLLLALGYQYLISRGDPTQIKAIRERIIRYFIGFALVFLAVPILTTIFRFFAINDSVQCYSGLTGSNNVGIGFQFFFTDLCTDPRGLNTNPCDLADVIGDRVSLDGRYACGIVGDSRSCTFTLPRSAPVTSIFCCTQERVWTSYIVGLDSVPAECVN